MTRRRSRVPDREVPEVFARYGPGRAVEALATIHATAESHGSDCACSACRYVYGEVGDR